MNKILSLFLFLSFIAMHAQRSEVLLNKITKNPIRKTNLILSKGHGDKAANPALKTKAVSGPKLLTDKEAVVEDATLIINNPNSTPLKFVLGTNDVMSIITVQPKSFWKGDVVDSWQNFVIRTGKKDNAYSIRSYNCFNIVWNAGKNLWDLEKTRCAKYIDYEK